MPRAALCDACGVRSSEGGHVRRLNELGYGPENEAKAIHLCDGCLEQRRARRWTMDDAIGQRVYRALHDRHQVSHDRYTYLMEETEQIHLLRLRPDWVDQRAADT